LPYDLIEFFNDINYASGGMVQFEIGFESQEFAALLLYTFQKVYGLLLSQQFLILFVAGCW